MEELSVAVSQIAQALSPDGTIGQGCSAVLIGLLLLAILLFRRQIGELLGRAVYLRLFGLEIIAQPRHPPVERPSRTDEDRACPERSTPFGSGPEE